MSNKKDNNNERIQNLIKLGVSPEHISEMINKGFTLDQIEDYCNNKINDTLDTIMKEIIDVFSSNMGGYKFFTIIQNDVQANVKIKQNIKKLITDILLSHEIQYKNIDVVFKSILDTMGRIFSDSQDNYKKVREELFAKMLKRDMFLDITLNDIHDNHLELCKKEENSEENKEEKPE